MRVRVCDLLFCAFAILCVCYSVLWLFVCLLLCLIVFCVCLLFCAFAILCVCFLMFVRSQCQCSGAARIFRIEIDGCDVKSPMFFV